MNIFHLRKKVLITLAIAEFSLYICRIFCICND